EISRVAASQPRTAPPSTPFRSHRKRHRLVPRLPASAVRTRSAAPGSWLEFLQLMLPEQANAAHFALDGARHTIQTGRDLFVGAAFDLPKGYLSQFRFWERI